MNNIDCKQYIYTVQTPHGGKAGRTCRPHQRLKELEATEYILLRQIPLLNDIYYIERKVHEELKQHFGKPIHGNEYYNASARELKPVVKQVLKRIVLDDEEYEELRRNGDEPWDENIHD